MTRIATAARQAARQAADGTESGSGSAGPRQPLVAGEERREQGEGRAP